MRIDLVFAAALMAVPLSALGQETSLGEREYMNSCASCHGADAKGAGPLAELLSVSLPDLTGLQTGNGGVFPVSEVYGIIEGASMVGAHGTREMPVWGDRYSFEANTALGDYFTGQDREIYVRSRILALIEYLSTVQE